MVTIQILCPILEFAVHSLVQVFNNRDSGRFGVFEMCLDVFDKHGQALCPKTKWLRDCALVSSSVQHEPCVPDAHLSAADGIAIPVMLNKTERPAQPGNGLFHISIVYVREHYISRYRAIRNHGYRHLFVRSHPAGATTSFSNINESGAACIVKKRHSATIGTGVIPLLRVGLVL
jgi:hypothetical protein